MNLSDVLFLDCVYSIRYHSTSCQDYCPFQGDLILRLLPHTTLPPHVQEHWIKIVNKMLNCPTEYYDGRTYGRDHAYGYDWLKDHERLPGWYNDEFYKLYSTYWITDNYDENVDIDFEYDILHSYNSNISPETIINQFLGYRLYYDQQGSQ